MAANINGIVKNGIVKNGLIATILIAIIRFYRFAFSALLGHCCRFEPSCSAYAIEAINLHGCIKGCCFATWRVLRCHPWHPGGKDPVPLGTQKPLS